MPEQLKGKRIAFLLANSGVDQVELTTPWDAVEKAGDTPVLIAPEKATVQAFNNDVEKADTFDADEAVADVSVVDFDALVLPGGTTNPDALRLDGKTMAFVGAFAAAGKPIAAICHGPWSLVEADVVRGKALTSWPSLKTDIRNAGGEWHDPEELTCTQGSYNPRHEPQARRPGRLREGGGRGLREGLSRRSGQWQRTSTLGGGRAAGHLPPGAFSLTVLHDPAHELELVRFLLARVEDDEAELKKLARQQARGGIAPLAGPRSMERLRAECASKRQLIGTLQQLFVLRDQPFEKPIRDAAAQMLQSLAMPYAEHRGYRAYWPETGADS